MFQAVNHTLLPKFQKVPPWELGALNAILMYLNVKLKEIHFAELNDQTKAFFKLRVCRKKVEGGGEGQGGRLKDNVCQTHFSSASTASETCSEPTGRGSNVFPLTCPAMTKTSLLSL